MVSKELRKLNRRELIDIIYQMKKNEQQMQEQIAATQAELEENQLRLAQVGSITDAAMAVTNALSATQQAADGYLRQLASMKAELENEQKKIMEQTRNLQPKERPRKAGSLCLPKVGKLILRRKKKNAKP